MQAVLLVIHLFACIALVIAVMLQRSEGGALGMGGGGTGGIISGRGAANVLVRTTMVLATVFFITSIVMTRLNAEDARAPTELQKQLQQEQTKDPLGGLTTTPSTTPTTPPASTTPDPLAPAGATPAPSTTTAPATTPATRDPLAPATATTPTPAPAATPTTPTPATPTTPPTQ